MSDSDHYDALGVSPSAPHATIRAAYRRIIRSAHPDIAGGDPQATDRVVRANVAWSVLRDPQRRAAYDRQRMRSTVPSPSSGSAAGSPAKRSDGGDGIPSWGPSGLRPVTVQQLREAAARHSAYSEIGRTQRRAFSAASWRIGVAITAAGTLILSLFALAG